MIVVAFGAPEQLARALAGVTALRTIVVDNSSDIAVRSVTEACGATYVDPGRNLGFGRGVNRGLQLLEGTAPTDVLLLNPDATFEGEAILTLQRYLHTSDDIAAVSPRLVDPSGSAQRVEWPFPSPHRSWLEAIGLGRLNDRRRDFLVGAVLLLRGESLQEIGAFDERFFLYAEEADWQRRARRSGWRVGVARGLVAMHVGAGTSTDSTRRTTLFHAGQETYIRKWYGRTGWLSYRLAALLGGLVRAVVLSGPAREAAAVRVRLYRAGPRKLAGLEQELL